MPLLLFTHGEICDLPPAELSLSYKKYFSKVLSQKKQKYKIIIIKISFVTIIKVNKKMTLGEIIRYIRQNRVQSLSDVCNALDHEITESQLSKVERGKQDCSWTFLKMVSEHLEIPVEIFTENIASPVQLEASLRAKKMVRKIVPVLSWSQIEQGCTRNCDGARFIDGPSEVGKDCFAVQVTCNDMESFNGGPSFPKGSMLFVDTKKSIGDGSYVIAIVNGGATFKECRIDRNGATLRPLNNQYPIIQMDNKGDEIIGVVVATRQIFVNGVS